MEPFDVNEVYTSDASHNIDVDNQIFSSDIINVLNEHIPANIRADYRRFIEGASLPKNKKDKLLQQIKAILAKHYNEDW